jgi:hypothetical protein
VVVGSAIRSVARAATSSRDDEDRELHEPSTPIPRTLPISRSRARTVARTTSTTRLCFSSTTPVSTVNPKLKIPTRMSTAPIFADQKSRLFILCLRLDAATAGGCCASARPAWSTLPFPEEPPGHASRRSWP